MAEASTRRLEGLVTEVQELNQALETLKTQVEAIRAQVQTLAVPPRGDN